MKPKLTIDIITLFPALFLSPLRESIIKIAQEKKLVAIRVHDLRDFTHDKHKTADDKPYGGGPGMVMKPEPIFECVEALRRTKKKQWVVYLTPQGTRFDQRKAESLLRKKHMVLLCGHYEGIDQRVCDELIDEEISIGDYVTSGGEIPALCLIDTIIRLVPGVLGNKDSIIHESFQNNMLDYPHYTRPREYRGLKVPAVLLAGNHKKIAEWRTKKALAITKKRRNDLLVP